MCPLDDPIQFETSPDRYRHMTLAVDGHVARLLLHVRENEGLRPGYALKLNSYDLSVDIELADAVRRLRFEHPQVGAVLVTSATDGVFCAGANIFMLSSSSHGFKVNFCKFTNETRLEIEDASAVSGQRYIAGLNGIASGGGYELPLACDEIYLVDDRRSAVALPEVPYLGVLPGTGGLTRLVDKRGIRRDVADLFCTLAEGFKGRKAKALNLVDDVFPTSRFRAALEERLAAAAAGGHPERQGVQLESLDPTWSDEGIAYRHVTLTVGPEPRLARLTLTVPDQIDLPDDPAQLGGAWFPLRAFRELDDALLHLRFNLPEIGLVLLHTRGSAPALGRLDAYLEAHREHWFVREVIHLIKRTLKRLDVTSKSFFALVDEGSCFCGTLAELALAADRTYMLDDEAVRMSLSWMNGGALPMGNGLSRLHTRWVRWPGRADEILTRLGPRDSAQAAEEGLVTLAYDDLDWEDELRLAIEERTSLSPDALTGMEANLRFAGPETLETKIFGRLSAWQNWIFQRPNAVGDRGALTLYGRPESAHFDWERT